MQIYELKKEFFKLNNISIKQWERRKDDLLIWLSNFYDYEIFGTKPLFIKIKEQYGDYQPLPRKVPSQENLTKEKEKDYTEFTIAALGTEFKPNSRAKIARDAIDEFGLEKYGHSSTRSVVARYVKKPFDTYGETNDKSIWVYFSTYTPIESDILEKWRSILAEEHISEEEAANAFYRQEQGQDISKEKSYYKKAMERFKEEYKDIPVLVKEWKLKRKNK